MELTLEQKIALLTKKVNSLGADIKAINEQGRLTTTDSNAIILFKGMFSTIKDTLNQFMDAWNELLAMYMVADKESEFPSQNEAAFFQCIKRYYYEACATFEKFKINETSVTSFTNRTYLPKIALPHFSGQPNDWQLFKDSYLSLVHNDYNLQIIEKYHFLIGALKGPALAVVRSIPFTEANYGQAWNALIKTYDSQRKLASSYLSRLLNFKPLLGKASASALNSFLLSAGESVNAFKNLQIPDTTEFILFELAVRCLDPTTREAFEIKNANVEFPTYSELIKFVENRAQALSIMEDSSLKIPVPKPTTSKISNAIKSYPQPSSFFANTSSDQSPSSSTSSQQPPTCFLCKNTHKLTDCQLYLSYLPHQRFNVLRDWAGCKNCLFPGHKTNQCTSKWKCRECGGRHHTTLHFPKPPQKQAATHTTSQPPKVISANSSEIPPSPATALASTSATQTNVLLGTAIAQIKDANGCFHNIRVVIDSGSQYSFISDTCFKKLGLPSSRFDRTIAGVGHSALGDTKLTVSCRLRPSTSTSPELNTYAVVIPVITPYLPQVPLPVSIWKSYSKYTLADPNFWRPGPIDFLLGADLFMDVIIGSPITLEPNYPKLVCTIFGHVVVGRVAVDISTSPAVALLAHSKEDLSGIIHKFWEVEEVKSLIPSSPEDKYCEDHFIHTHSRLASGRYVVSLPFKTTAVTLGSSRQRALQRLHNLETKLSKDSTFFNDYKIFMTDYINLNHMTISTEPGKYIIPHHGVHKIDNGISKLRVVFDGSSKTSLGSLNDHLLAGPKLQKDIGDIILNFRRHRYALTTDIIKMYRQIVISAPDRLYQHILWRFAEGDTINEYELSTVTYGLKSSPFLALRVISQLVSDEGSPYPLASHALSEDVYIDDIVTGASDMSEVINMKDQLIQLLSKGGFSLSKWASNCPDVLDSINKSDIQPLSFCGSDDISLKILGLQWDPTSDVFTYSIHLPSLPLTKRGILSSIARIYDPLGYLSPVVFLAKRILQETWKIGINWDDLVPDLIHQSWVEFVNDIPNLGMIRIPRYLYLDCESECSLFGFCDASQLGYCAVLYLKVANGSHNNIFLIKAKTKLAPIKPLSIPRLELCAALLLTSLYISTANFRKHLKINYVKFFSDSTIVLSWLKTPPHLLQTFVAHRVIRIMDSSDLVWWHHIPTQDNPADCGSRGLLPSQLISHHLWWSGPTWVCQPEHHWPSSSVNIPCHNLPELKTSSASLVSTTVLPDIITWMERFSKYSILIRSMAYVLRFVSILKGYSSSKGVISAQEYKNANQRCIQILQRFYYPEAFCDTSKHTNLLRSLKVFQDQAGVVRVGGRLQFSSLPDSHKHPILLPRRSHFTSLIVDHFHRIHLHAGVSTIHAAIQRSYWIPGGRSLVKQRKRKCLTCFKSVKPQHNPPMGNLPSSRFSDVRAFFNCGVDFAGPFLCRETTRRKSSVTKAYLCLFVCFSTKALHLETVPQLTTLAFIDALDRFIARRGNPSRISSDCGTNFIGAARYLRDLYEWHANSSTQQDIINHLSPKGIEWAFNPPHSPHFGGLWEAGVKSVKTLLFRIIGNQPFTFVELNTMFIKIEGILNSRPLIPLSSDPEDLDPLTPGHFLIGGPISALPETDLTDQPLNRLTRWQLLKERIQTFWQRWKNEYLHTLQQRHKWTKSTPNLKPGDLVLVKDAQSSPFQWPLARIIEVHPGTDQVVRVATIKTATNTYQRPAVKLVPLASITSSPQDLQEDS